MKNPFEQFQTDTIRIIDKSGNNVSNDYKAQVTHEKISLYDINVEVEEGDFIERDLPNNRTERYKILEVIFHQEFHVIPAHFIFKVTKTNAIKHFDRTRITYNLTGNNARVYHNSQDQSNNTVNNNPDPFDLLKKEISNNILESSELLASLEELKQSKGQDDYLKKYASFISLAADHITIISPFIPALTAFLT